MKIKEHLKDAFTNPLGNLLAVANLAMLAFVESTLSLRPEGYDKLVCDLNGPAVVASVILTGKLTSFALIPPLVYLQWVFIGWMARRIAAAIRQERA